MFFTKKQEELTHLTQQDITTARKLFERGEPHTLQLNGWSAFMQENAIEFTAEELGLVAHQYFFLADLEYTVLVLYQLDEGYITAVALYTQGHHYGELMWLVDPRGKLGQRIANWLENGQPAYHLNPYIGGNK